MERRKLTEKETTKLLLDNEEVCSDESARIPSNDNDSDNNLILFNPNTNVTFQPMRIPGVAILF